MARTESRTKCSIWRDKDFLALSDSAQLLYWRLNSQPTISLCGVLPLTVRRWARMSATASVEGVRAALAELASAPRPFIVIDDDSEELWVRSFVDDDGVLKSPKTREAAWNQLDAIVSSIIRPLAEQELGPPDAGPGAKAPESLNAQANTLWDTPSDTPRERAHAASNPHLLSPSPSSSSAPFGAGDVAMQRKPGDDPPDELLRLTQRIIATCTANDRQVVQAEACEVVAWAAPVMASTVIDEEIGFYRRSKTPPTFPCAIAKALERRARREGLSLVPFPEHRHRRHRGHGPPVVWTNGVKLPNLSLARTGAA